MALAQADGPTSSSSPPRSSLLRPYIAVLWDYNGGDLDRYERLAPGSSSQLLVNRVGHELRFRNLDGSVRARARAVALQGMLTAPVLIDSDQKRSICGVQFTPGGMSAFHPLPAASFTDALVDAEHVWGKPVLDLRRELQCAQEPADRLELIERFLHYRLRSEIGDDAVLRTALKLLEDGAPVQAVRDRLGLSSRALHSLFDQRVGVRPKAYARLARIGKTIGDLSDRHSWSDLAANAGFADQAHLVREFRALTGRTPTAYRPVSPDEPHHALE